jgi:hypothetical protein
MLAVESIQRRQQQAVPPIDDEVHQLAGLVARL